MYHREARLPIDVELLPQSDEHGPTVEDYVDAMSKVQDGVKPKVMANISKAQEYQKQYYSQRHATQVCCMCLCSYVMCICSMPDLCIFVLCNVRIFNT